MMNLKNSNCDETQKIKLWWNSKTQTVMKFKKSYCDETQKLKFWQNLKLKLCPNSKTQILTKLKFWQNSNCEKKINNSKCEGKKLKLGQNSKLKLWQNLNYDKSQFMRRKKQNLKGFLVGTFWHLDNRWDALWAAFCVFCNVFCELG